MAADAKEGKDLQALAAIYREAQRVRLYGFTAGEYDRMKAEYLSQLESAYVNRNKVKNAQYGDELRDHYLANEPIPSKEDDYQIMKQLVEMPALNVDVINKYAQELITDKDSNFVAYIFAQEKAGATYPTEAQMAQTINAVRAEKIEPYVDNVKQEPLLDEKKLPKAGKIVGEKENKVLGYKELTLSNGARVILKKTDFKDNEIQFQVLRRAVRVSMVRLTSATYNSLMLSSVTAVWVISHVRNYRRHSLVSRLLWAAACQVIISH